MSKDVAKNETSEAPFSVPKLPSKFKDDFGTFTSGMYLPRMQLEGSSSKLVKTKRITTGNFALITGRDAFEDLGTSVDILVLDYRSKALDLTDLKDVVSSYDKNSSTFKDIVEKAGRKSQGYLYGLEFLVYIPLAKNDQKFATLFMGNPTARVAARNFKPLIGKAVTMKAEVIDNGTHIWDGPVVLPCNSKLAHLPTEEEMTSQLDRFLNPVEGEAVEAVTESEEAATTGRDR